MLRVLIVDDSSFARKVIVKMLTSDPEIEIVGEAEDGYQALKLATELDPDAIVLDLIMPDPDGLWIVQNVMKKKPIPVVLFSGITEANAEITKEAFRYGILDVIKKPANPNAIGICREELISKVKAAARSKSSFELLFSSRQLTPVVKAPSLQTAKSAVAIVASAGSPAILSQLLKNISMKHELIEPFNMAVLVALHIPKEFLDSYIKAVSESVSFAVLVPKEGDIIRKNTIYFSPAEKTLCVKKTHAGAVAKMETPPVRIQPHFDDFLKSAAETFRKKTIAIVLSGMGNHGLEGARVIKKEGGKVIVQKPSTAGVSAMPQSVLDDGLADEVSTIQEMADVILYLGNRNLISGGSILPKREYKDEQRPNPDTNTEMP